MARSPLELDERVGEEVHGRAVARHALAQGGEHHVDAAGAERPLVGGVGGEAGRDDVEVAAIDTARIAHDQIVDGRPIEQRLQGSVHVGRVPVAAAPRQHEGPRLTPPRSHGSSPPCVVGPAAPTLLPGKSFCHACGSPCDADLRQLRRRGRSRLPLLPRLRPADAPPTRRRRRSRRRAACRNRWRRRSATPRACRGRAQAGDGAVLRSRRLDGGRRAASIRRSTASCSTSTSRWRCTRSTASKASSTSSPATASWRSSARRSRTRTRRSARCCAALAIRDALAHFNDQLEARARRRAAGAHRHQHRAGRRRHGRQRPEDGLHRDRRHHQPRRTPRVAGAAGHDPDQRDDGAPGARLLRACGRSGRSR